MNPEDIKKMRTLVILVVLTIVIPISLLVTNLKTLNYQVNGTRVEARVTYVDTIRVGKLTTHTVYVVYQDASGEVISATATNAAYVNDNDILVGRVLSSNPSEVFVEPPVWVPVTMNVVAVICLVGGGISLVIFVRKLRRN